jgi:hypothetical protein
MRSFESGTAISGDPLAELESRSGIDYALRTLAQGQLHLSAMADAKANIMITVCSIVISASLTQLHRPAFRAPLLTLDAFTAVALLSALLCVLPGRWVPRRPDGGVDRDSPRFNPLFFMHFRYLSPDEFEAEIGRRFADTAGLYRSLVRDIYEQGLVLARSKYRYLRASYASFIAGLLLGTGVAVAEMLL